MGRKNYRWIWKKANGPIPKDENGISYQIHHIDGNNKNNELSNLKLVTLDEHIEIHRKQKDWASVAFLEQMRGRKATGWKHSDETKKKISEKQKQQYQSGERIHPMLGVKRPDLSERNKQGPTEESRKKMSEAKQNQPELACPHCGKIGKGGQMYRWHFDNCKTLKT